MTGTKIDREGFTATAANPLSFLAAQLRRAT